MIYSCFYINSFFLARSEISFPKEMQENQSLRSIEVMPKRKGGSSSF